MSMPRYSEYKDSGVAWLGEVPVHWEVMRLKRNLQLLTEKTERREHPVALENIESWSGRFVETETDFLGEGIAFEPGDILFGKLRPYLAKAYLADIAGEAVGDFHVMRPSENVDGRFAQYQILNRDFITIVDGSTFGAKMPRASWDFLCNMEFATPPLEEQQTIAAFLDREMGKIDALIAEQRRLVELLAEKRQAVISHAVTKGLNSNAKMKDSGIEWLGEVPAHWQIEKASWHFSAKKGSNAAQLTKEYCATIEGDYPVYSGQTENNGVMSSICQYEFDAGNDGFLFSTTVGAKAMSLMHLKGRFSLSQNCMVIIPVSKSISVKFYYYHFQPLFSFERGLIPEHMQASFRMEDLYQYRIALPPIEEQKQIEEYLDCETAKFDTLTTEANRAIELLQERRSALISAAVTGKIDVRPTQTLEVV